MKHILLILFSILPISIKAQMPAEIINCSPDFYNKVDALITNFVQKTNSDAKVDSMRIDSLEHSILADTRFVNLLDKGSEFFFGDPNDELETQFWFNVETGRDERFLSYLNKNQYKNKILAWEKALPKGLNGFLVVAKITCVTYEKVHFRVVFGINKSATEVLWVTEPKRFINWTKISNILRYRKIMHYSTWPYTSNEYLKINFGRLRHHK